MKTIFSPQYFMESIKTVQRAINLLSEIDQDSKNEGLDLLSEALQQKELISLGYDKLIFQELIKLANFEEDCLEKTLTVIERNYFPQKEYHDKLAELLIYRVARSNKFDVCKICLLKLSTLMDFFDESIAKHSKQILKLTDLNDMLELNPILSDILNKMKTKLPQRKTCEFE